MTLRKKILLSLIGLIPLGLLLAGMFLLFSNEYNELITLIHRSSDDFIYKNRFGTIFTLERFNYARILLIVFAVSGIAANIFLIRNAEKVELFLLRFYKDVLSICRDYIKSVYSLKKSNRNLFLVFALLIIASRIYLFNKYPFNGDEIFSFFAYIQNGFLYTWAYYPEPNNHILYNLVCIPFDVAFNDPLWVMRFPNILLNFLLLILVFIFLLRNTDYSTALLAFVMLGFAFCPTIYSVHGRGYTMMSFFTILSAFTFFKLIQCPNNLTYRTLFVLFCILGAFTIPIFILPFTAYVAYGFFVSYKRKDRQLFKNILFSVFLIGLGVVLVYLPVIVVSGPDSLSNNNYISPATDMKKYFLYIIPVASVEAIDFMLGSIRGGYILILLFAPLVVFAILKRKGNDFIKHWLVFIIFCVFSVYAIFLLKRVFGEVRTFTFGGYLFFISLSFVLMMFINLLPGENYKKITIVVIGVFFMLLIPLSFDKKMKKFYGDNYLESYKKKDKLFEYIYAKNPKKIFVTEEAIACYLKYNNKVSENPDIDLHMIEKKEVQSYDFILLDDDSEFPKHLQKDDYVNLNYYPGSWLYENKENVSQ